MAVSVSTSVSRHECDCERERERDREREQCVATLCGHSRCKWTPGIFLRDEFLVLSMSWRGMASHRAAWHGMTSQRIAWLGTMALARLGVRSGFRRPESALATVGFR